MKETKKCLECGRELYGRSDKKFCNNSCKNHYHNQHSHNWMRLRDRVTNDLEKNHRILEGVMRLGLSAISLYDATGLGFKASRITGCVKAGRHYELRCFDICYRQTPEKITNIRRCVAEETKQACQAPPPQSYGTCH